MVGVKYGDIDRWFLYDLFSFVNLVLYAELGSGYTQLGLGS